MGFKDRFKKIFRSDKKENNEIVQENEIVEFDASTNDDFEKDLEVTGENNPYEFELSPNGNVLFVGNSNTGRSPIAEAIFNQKATGQKAFSAGVNAQNGDPASDDAIIVCANHGIDLSGHRTQNIGIVPLHEMDLVLAATANIRLALKIVYPNLEVFTINEYIGNYSNGDIDDPSGGNISDYEKCFGEIFEAILKIIDFEDSSDKPVHIDAMTESIPNFKYLDYLIHSGEKNIVLTSDIILEDDEIFNYGDGIKIDVDDLVIDGNGHSIDANGKARIFECSAKNITLKNITLKNGFAKEYGGAIYSSSELKILSSIFDGNIAGFEGGAIYTFERLYVEDSTFNGNVAHKGDGGAIYNTGVLSIVDSRFNRNTASFNGGSIYNWAEASVEDSTFNTNASDDGGAIYNTGVLSIVDSRFNRNIARKNGGFLYNFGEAYIEDSTVEGNNAEKCGGAIYNYNDKLKISNSVLNENSSNGHGGVIMNTSSKLYVLKCIISNNDSQNDIICNDDYLDITSSVFKNNQSKYILLNKERYESDKIATIGIFNCKFKENNVFESVVFNKGKFFIIEKGFFEDNLSNDNSMNIINHTELRLNTIQIKDEGKTILNEGYVFVKNPSPDFSAKIYGQGTVETNLHPGGEQPDFENLNEKIHINHDYEDEWVKVTFNGNVKEVQLKSDFSLAAYEFEFFEGGIELDIDDVVIDGNFKTIDAKDKSRIFLITGKNITLKNMTFKGGHSYTHYDSSNNNGGAIKINRDGNTSIINCNFETNVSDGSGGAIYNPDGELNIVESIFIKNMAKGSGGAINHVGDLTIMESTLNKNTSSDSGGALYSGGKSYIEKTAIDENTADSGGGINNGGKMTIKSSVISLNTAESYYGGAINNGDELEIIDCALKDNFAERDGGAIHNNCADLSLIGSAFSGNRANENGDAIFNYRENSFKVENCDLEFWDIKKYNEYDGGD